MVLIIVEGDIDSESGFEATQLWQRQQTINPSFDRKPFKMENPDYKENVLAEYNQFVDRLFVAIRSSYKGLLSILLIGVVITLVYSAYDYTQKKNNVTYFIEFLLKGSYPNGAAFSVRDLVAPDIIKALAAKHNIKDYEKFVRSLAVIPSSPFLSGLNRKYDDLLHQKNLTIAETAAINANYQNEVNEFSSRGAVITVKSEDLGINFRQSASIASDLPEIWNQITLKKYNVINDKFLAYIDIPGKFRKFDTSLNIMQTEQYLESISSGLNSIVADGRLLSVKASNGQNVADLRADLARFTQIYFYPIFLFYNKKDELIYNAYLEEIKLAMGEVDTKINNIDVVIADVKQQRNEASGSLSSHDTVKSRDILDIGENSIGSIVNLANKASMSDYLKEAFEKRAALVAEKAALQRKNDRLVKHSADTNSMITQEFRLLAEAEFEQIINSYHSLVEACREKLDNTISKFYLPLSQPESAATLRDELSNILVGSAITSFILFLYLGYAMLTTRSFDSKKKI